MTEQFINDTFKNEASLKIESLKLNQNDSMIFSLILNFQNGQESPLFGA